MTNYNTVVFISKLIRGLLKDGIKNNNNSPAIWEYEGDNAFTLPDDYVDSTTIVVKKNGTILSAGWSYNATTNQITISISLTVGDKITATYNFYEKYSLNELTDYIEGSLPYFAQYTNRLFVLSDDRLTIEAFAGLDPSLNEIYQIAIIASIVIDPQNVDIKTKEFSVSASEFKSKSESIGSAFTQFSNSVNFLGEFTFDEALNPDNCTQ
jgi:hypothetical protein